jgi:Tfp pilus assembly protein PilO
VTNIRRILSEKRRLIWPLTIGLLVNAALFALVVYPLSVKVEGGERQAQAAAAELAAARRDQAAALATVTGKSQADAELKKFYSEVLPPDVSGARRSTYLTIEHIAQKASLTQVRRSSERSQGRESALGKLTWTVVLSGDYRSIRHFIHEIETAPEFMVLEDVAVSQGEDRERALSVTVRVSTYFRAEGDGD